MRQLHRREVLAALPALASWPGIAGAQGAVKKYGLVIGNGAYPDGIGKLKNASADADLVAQTLIGCGFEVPASALVKNASRGEFMQAVRNHTERVRSAGAGALGFFYYAGHGAANADGGNYLIPIVEQQEVTAALWDESVELKWLFEVLGQSPNPHIVALDACRNSLRLPQRAIGGGSFRSLRDEGREVNTFISYSTWEGQTASDGEISDSNGPYASALATHLGGDNLGIVETFDLIRIEVRTRTEGVQEPMNLSRLARAASVVQLTRSTPPAAAPLARPGGPTTTQALVIGCGYPGSSAPLLNTVNDARKVAAALTRSGFETAISVNPARERILEDFIRFSDRLHATNEKGVGFAFVSGYAAQVGGVNYLVPNGPVPQTEIELLTRGVTLEEITQIVADRGRPNTFVLLLDCARRLPGEWPAGGLADFNFGRPRTMVASSQRPGALVQDTTHGSVFAAIFAEEIVRPERRRFFEIMDTVGRRVEEQTRSSPLRQTPWFSSTPLPLYFRDGAALGDMP